MDNNGDSGEGGYVKLNERRSKMMEVIRRGCADLTYIRDLNERTMAYSKVGWDGNMNDRRVIMYRD